ncbi:hypothetical protein [Marinobacter alexandrii]|uniref:hypothetical protein n=1 Tax=Marinobacter alexandrii TaxID=2570351 RepID=UPI0011096935|nr:hypothetical protein [Marinobacter alexandrii]
MTKRLPQLEPSSDIADSDLLLQSDSSNDDERKLPFSEAREYFSAQSVQRVASRTEMKAINAAADYQFSLDEGGRSGDFVVRDSAGAGFLIIKSVTSTSVDATTDTITSTAHGLVDGDGVKPTTTVNGLTAGQLYWVVGATANTFQLSLTYGGAAVDLTGTTNFTVDHMFDPLEGRYALLDNGNYVERILQGPVLFRHYGALGTGAADDTAAVVYAVGTGLDCDGEGSNYTYLMTGAFSLNAGQKVTNFHFKKGFNGEIVSGLPDSAKLLQGEISGESASFTGGGVVIASGDSQHIVGVDILDVAGHPVEVTGSFAQKALFEDGIWASATPGTQSIKFAAATYANGDMTISNIYCQGGNLVDLGGRQNVLIDGCNMTDITFGTSTKTTITGCRLAILGGTLQVSGSNQVLVGNSIAGDVELVSGANFCVIGPNTQDGEVIDNSGLRTNTITESKSLLRGWVNFDGTIATPSIRGQYGVSSVVKLATGQYEVTLSSAFTNTGLSVTASGHKTNSVATAGDFAVNAFVFSGDKIRVSTTDSGAFADFATVSLSINGDA